MIRGAAAAGLSLTLGLTGLGLIGASALAGPASAAPAAATGTASAAGTSASLPNPTTQDCDPQPRYKAQAGTPWAQRVLDYRDVWQYTQGAGVTVAVIDSGVDGNPQFNNRVSEGQTLVKSQSGPADCVGHGTMVAGIIAAAPISGTSFVGVAPQAHILSIKVAEKDAGISSGTLAQAINQAVSAGVQVINVSIDTPTPDSRLQA
ncbi:MAG: S8 family serine peptidase, partial [Nocardiopsaceae bacterium]|nr:S8 family serine peptidase [Nocardiopsaceae bacterium]